MAKSNFAESVINGTYKRKEQREENTTQSSNSFADSVINGTYKKIEIDTTPRQIITSPPVQVNTEKETIPVQTQSTTTPTLQPTTQPTTEPLVYEGVSINPYASEEEKLKLIANNNLKQKQGAYDTAYENLKGKRQEYLTSQGIENDPMVRYNEATLEEKLTKPTRDEADKISKEANKYISVKDDLANETKNESEALSNANNQLKYAKYLKNVSDVQQEDTNLYDQTLGHLVRGAQDILSNLTDDNRFVDENGNVQYLPSYNSLKQQKVQESYGDSFWGDLARFAGDVGYEGGKIGASIGLNAVVPYSGTALYFSDIYGDSYKQNINEGMDNETAMLNAFLKTGQNYIKQKIIGGIGGKLTNSDASWLEKTLSNGWSKVASDPRVVSILSSMSAEAIDEFTDTYMEKLIDAATKDNTNLGDLLSPDTFLEALYSGAVGGATGAMGGFNGESLQNAQNALNQRINENINQQQNISQQTPQIEQNTQENINNQPNIETPNIELESANNEPITQTNEEKSKTGFDKSRDEVLEKTKRVANMFDGTSHELSNEQKLDLINSSLEMAGYDTINSLDEAKQKSIASDSNTFNLGKINENTTLNNLRNSEDISNRKVNAYQYDNPEVKPFFVDAAYDLKDALETTTKGERWTYADGTWGGTKFRSTPEITELKEKYNMSYKDLDRGIDGIIKDEGAENNAASKKVELVIDKMLRNGYRSQTLDDTINPNQEYLDTISGKQVDNETNQELNEESPFFTEEEDREFAEKQKQIKEKLEREIKAREQQQNNNLAETKSEDVLTIENKPKSEETAKPKLTPQQEEQHLIDNGVEPKVAKIISEMEKPEKAPLSQRIKEGKATLREEWGEFKRAVVDKGETIYNLGKKLKNRVLYPKYDKIGTTRGEANYSIEKGQTDLNGNKYENFTDKNGKKTSMSLNQIWDGVDSEVANQYLADWLNVDRYGKLNETGRNIQEQYQEQIDKGAKTQEDVNEIIKANDGYVYVYGTPDVTPEISKERIAKLEKEHPELKRFGENVWQYGRNMLQNMVDGGLVSEQQAQQFMQETPHYVRLQRNVPTDTKSSANVKNNQIVVDKPTKNEFKGSNIDILPFKNSMADYTFEVAKAIRTNIFAQELGKAMSVSSTDDNVTSLDDSFGIRPDLLKDNGDGTYSLTLFNNGVATVIPIDQGIYESLTPNKHYKFENKTVFKGIRKVDKIRKALLTDKNPLFLATNAFKDFFDAPLNSKYPASFHKNYVRAIMEVANNGKYYQQYQALGGLQNTYFENGQFKKDGSKLNPINWIERGNNAIEQIPRLAEFISTMEKTGDINQAMYNAAEVTTNFKRGGDVAKAANRNGATFLNASIQGFDKQVRNFTDIFSKTDGKINIDKRQAVQLLGKIVTLGIAPGLINDMMYGDDDEYEDMQDYIKDRYYLFKVGGTWIRIPKGRAVSVFQSAARRTGEAMDGNEDAFKGFMNFASTQVAPNNPFENNIASPIIDVLRNESWSGNAIVPDSYKNMHTSEQWNEKTDEFSKWLGSALNISPMKINYLLDQYSGAIGDILLPMNTAKATSATDNILLKPWADKFTTDAAYSDKNLSVFYDTKNKLEGDYKSVDSTKEDKLKYNYLNSKNTEISKLRKEQSRIQSDSELSKTEKYEKAREIQKQINELAKKSVQDLDNIEYNDYYAIVGDDVYRLVYNDDGTQSFSKDSYADSHKKSAEKQGIPLYDYYRQQYEKGKEKNSK